MSKLYKLLLYIIFIPSLAFAQSYSCPTSCVIPDDCDFDGFTTLQDCDDTDPSIFPGQKRWTGTAFERCETGAVWTTFTPDYFVDCSLPTNGTGTISSPFNTTDCVDSEAGCPSGGVTPIAGESVVIANCGQENLQVELDINGISGTNVEYCGDPRQLTGNHIKAVNIASADYITVRGFRIENEELDFFSLNGAVDNGLITVSTRTTESDGVEIVGNTLQGFTNATTDGSNTGLIFLHTTNNVYVHNNVLLGVDTPNDPDHYNSAGIMVFRSSNMRLDYNYFPTPTTTTNRVNAIRIKHADEISPCAGSNTDPSCIMGPGGDSISGNLILNWPNLIESGQQNMTFSRNYLVGGDLVLKDGGGPSYITNINVDNNTIVGGCIKAELHESDLDSGATTYGPVGWTGNVCSTNSTYSAGGDNLLHVSRYGSDAIFSDVVVNSAVTSANNCYWNSGNPILYGFFQADSAGTQGGSCNLTDWQGTTNADCPLALDAGSVETDPLLDVCGCTTATACTDINSGYCAKSTVVAPGIVSLDATVASCSEDTGICTATVSLTEPAPVGGVTVTYTISGTATNGTDYFTITGTITIPEGILAGTININVLADTIFEGNETVILNLVSADQSYTINTINNNATLTIIDNDIAPPTTAPTGTSGKKWWLWNVKRKWCKGTGWFCRK